MTTDIPSPELDLAVAKAVGFRQKNAPGSGSQLYIFADSRGTGRLFRPSTDMTDAMKAAEKVGLFSPDEHQGCLHGSIHGGFVVADRYGGLHIAPTGPLAICAAILKIKETP